MPLARPAEAPGGRRLSLTVVPFLGDVVYRQVRYARRRLLWIPSIDPYRWSVGFPALYTSLFEDVAIAERIKRTGADPTRIVLGTARTEIQSVADLITPTGLAAAGVTLADITGPGHVRSQRLGREAYDRGVAGLLVPAAIFGLAEIFPTFRYAPARGRSADRSMPRDGVNLVLFLERFAPNDAFVRDVRPRRTVTVCGIPAG
ncbi:MAG: RES family NAD+ phosphorylase [Candidatus Omnitrophica bacterium]|nr:RES family NAD+ phosphorylase [Candidatus Omnitrophota bacterium]